MTRTLPRTLLGLALALGVLWPLTAAEPAASDLSEFKTVDTAITTTIKRDKLAANVPGYLGVLVETTPQGNLAAADVRPDSPAAKAGVQKGDLILKVGDKEVLDAGSFRDLLAAHAAGDAVTLGIVRKNRIVELTATLGAASRPLRVDGGPRATFGVAATEVKDGEGVLIRRVAPDSPADKAGLKADEVIVKLDGQPVGDPAKVNELPFEKRPGDVVTVTVKRDGKPADIKVTLGAAEAGGPGGRGFDFRGRNTWKKPSFKLALICIEYPDAKHNAKITAQDWSDSMFSRDAYKDKKSATGQQVYGSLADYYNEISCGALKVEGKVFDWVEVKKNRMDYAPLTGGGQGRDRTALFGEAMDLILKRDGADALKDYDGVFFLYAGGRVNVPRGNLYWPHQGSFNHGGKSWRYFIVGEGGERMANISVFCHEFGHMLGLPDLYARPESPGSEGVGVWCCMSNQVGNGKPQHYCAWSKEQLGWIKPAVIDPTVKQKLILAPIEGNTKECFKVLARPDGSEYFLVENRGKKGNDESLPAHGLLIWRVVNNKPILEESHGVEGPSGPRIYLNAVPYPSAANDSFTPYTTPSSRAQLGNGLPVHITNIRRLPDGRITFYIGYEYE
jgi:M6 family metalloprotease-like protein